jgi:hypothetical protein
VALSVERDTELDKTVGKEREVVRCGVALEMEDIGPRREKSRVDELESDRECVGAVAVLWAIGGTRVLGATGDC